MAVKTVNANFDRNHSSAAWSDGKILAVTTTTARKAVQGFPIFTVTAIGANMLIKMGDAAVEAGAADGDHDLIVPDGQSRDIAVSSITHSHMAAIAITGSGLLYISGRK